MAVNNRFTGNQTNSHNQQHKGISVKDVCGRFTRNHTISQELSLIPDYEGICINDVCRDVNG